MNMSYKAMRAEMNKRKIKSIGLTGNEKVSSLIKSKLDKDMTVAELFEKRDEFERYIVLVVKKALSDE
jgi:hypothetical protein